MGMINTHIPTPEELSAMSPNQFKSVENRLRAAAARQGLRLDKSRSRDPRALDYGTYQLIDPATNSRAVTYGLLSGYGLNLSDVAWFLLGDPPAIHVDYNPEHAFMTFDDTDGQPILSYRAGDGWVLHYEESWCSDMREHYRPVPRAEAGSNPGDFLTGIDDDVNGAVAAAKKHLRSIGYREPQ